MYIVSRSVIPPLRLTASARNPFARFALLVLAKAIPQYAMAQLGSRVAACRNERSASKYQKPCNWPMPWLMNFCASGPAFVTGKLTGPVLPMRYARCRGPSLNVSPCHECPAAGGEPAGGAAGSSASSLEAAGADSMMHPQTNRDLSEAGGIRRLQDVASAGIRSRRHNAVGNGRAAPEICCTLCFRESK